MLVPGFWMKKGNEGNQGGSPMEFPITKVKSRFYNAMVGLSFVTALVCLISGCATSKG
jgi:hypothetical protein